MAMKLQKNNVTFLLDLVRSINTFQLKTYIYCYLPEFLLNSTEQHFTVASFTGDEVIISGCKL